jgi:hypothetical protein
MAALMLRRSLRMAGFALMGLFALFLMAGPAHAGEYTPPPGIVVDDPTPDPGGQVTVTGESCEVGATVTISLGGVVVGTAVVGADGTFTATFTVPADTAPGTYEVSVTNCATEVLGTTITVGGPQGTALPRTGSNSTEPLVRTGVVLVAAGVVLVYAVRRRQQATIS